MYGHEEDAKEPHDDRLLLLPEQHRVVDGQLRDVHALRHPQGGGGEPEQDRGRDDAHQRLAEVGGHVERVRDHAADDDPLASEVPDQPNGHDERGED